MPARRQSDAQPALHVGALIKRARRRKKIKQETLAAHLNMSQPHLSRIENGDHVAPSDDVLLRAAEFLDIDARELLRAAGRQAAGATFEQLTLERLDRHAALIELTHAKLNELLTKLNALQQTVDRIEQAAPSSKRAS
jgi:transcriptional regulator with XRE-family HTH domain